MKLFLAVLFTTMTFSMPLDWATDFEKAPKEANQSHKMILLNFQVLTGACRAPK